MSAHKIRLCAIGGGNLAHACTAELSSNGFKVDVLTRKPELWQKTLMLIKENQIIKTELNEVVDDKNILLSADYILLTLPANIRYEYLKSIKKYVKDDAIFIVAPSIAGINFIIEDLFPNNRYVCFQRVPYICRTIEYGYKVKSVPKMNAEVYFSKNYKDEYKKYIEEIFKIPLKELHSFWPLLLSNSNPIIHVARLCEILKDAPLDKIPLFYEEWGDYTSKLSIEMDQELAMLMKKLEVKEYRNLFDHYEVLDIHSLTKKINSIKSFKAIHAPMVKIGEKYIIDNNSRYITEDLPFGTCFIKYVATLLNIKTPKVDFVIETLQKLIGEEFIKDNKFDICTWIKYLRYNPIKYLDNYKF